MKLPSPDRASNFVACPVATDCVILAIGIFCTLSLRAADQPASVSAGADLGVGAEVVLTEPGTMLRDGQRQIPSRGERIFKVERLGNGFADVSTEDGTIRGWVEIDHVVPLEKAVEYFSGKIAVNPKDAQAYQARGRIWIEKEDWEHALADLDAAIRLAPADARNHHLRALDLFRNKQFEQAIAGFSEAIRLDPGFAVAYRDRGLAWDARRFFDKAFEDLSEAIRLDPENISLVMSRAKVCATRGRHTEAMADYARVLQRRPSDPAVYMARGEALLLDLQSEAAIADFTKALEVEPTATEALVLRGKAWNRHFQFARAIDDYAEAIRRAADDPAPRRALAWLLATCHDRAFRDGPRAVQEGTMACELTHWKSAECLDVLSAACAEAGDFTSAVKWQSQAVKLLKPGDKSQRRLFLTRRAMYEFKKPYRD
jgi:tetratricopeptide (TPR) repeat protein